MAWKRLQYLTTQDAQAFSATRDELAADANLFKSNL